MIGLVGRKVGMTRVFTEEGVSIPVTVVEVEANRISQVKTLETDGYAAIQVTTGAKKANRVTKPDRKSTRLNSSHANESRMPSSA